MNEIHAFVGNPVPGEMTAADNPRNGPLAGGAVPAYTPLP